MRLCKTPGAARMGPNLVLDGKWEEVFFVQ